MANKVSIGERLRGAVDTALYMRMKDIVFNCAGVALDREYDALARREWYVESVEHIGFYMPFLNGVPLSFEGKALDMFILTVEDNLLEDVDMTGAISQALRESHALPAKDKVADMFFNIHDTRESLMDFLGDDDKVVRELRAIIKISEKYETAEHMHIEWRPSERRDTVANAIGLGMRMGQLEHDIVEALEEQGDPGSYQLPITFMDSMFFWYANVKEDGQVDARTFYNSEDELREKFEKLLKTAPLMRGSHDDAEASLLPYWNGDIELNTGMSGNF